MYQPLLGISNPTERLSGEINYPSVDKGTAVIDLNNDTPIVFEICYSDSGTEWQSSVGGRKRKLIEPLATRSFSKLIFNGIKRCNAMLFVANEFRVSFIRYLCATA